MTSTEVRQPLHFRVPIGLTTWIVLSKSDLTWLSSDPIVELCAQHSLVPIDNLTLDWKLDGVFLNVLVPDPVVSS